MHGLTARWSFRLTPDGRLPPLPGPIPGVSATSRNDLPPLLGRVLHVRGLDDPAAATAFLDPRLTHLHDPSLIPDLDKAAERIHRAVCDGEPVVIYGDYDVDGITASAILYHTLKAIRPDAPVRTYVPHRIDEGYGLNNEALKTLAGEGAKVIVSVDCGITAVEPARIAREIGVDLIITDHHNPPEKMLDLPDAFAVVHPRRPDSSYPFGDLSGAGVAYKLAWRLGTLAGQGGKASAAVRTMLVELLAMAALGAIADIVPLKGENRVLACFGLVRTRQSGIVGLRALVEAAGLTGEDIGAMEVGFRLGPRLNAAGRMGHAREAVELFTTATGDRAREIAQHLSEQNDARRSVEKAIFEQAAQMAVDQGMTGMDRRAIVLAHQEWHPGVIGIVCSRLVERFHRPVILMHKGDGHAHGSGRSIDGFNLHAALVHCADLLERYGGHTMAAGMRVSDAQLGAFVDKFTGWANQTIPTDMLSARVTIDCEADASELDVPAVQSLERLGPFGAGNPSVRVLVRGMSVSQKSPMGAGGKHAALHLKCRPTLPSPSGESERVLRCIGWSWGEHLDKLPMGAKVDAVLKPRINAFNGRTTVEPEIVDLAVV